MAELLKPKELVMTMTTVIRRFLHPPTVPSRATSTHTPSKTHVERVYGLSRTVVVCFLGLSLAACSSPSERVFMQSCTYGGAAGNDDQCECAYEKITDHYPEEMLNKIEHPSQMPPDFDQVLAKAALECRSE